MKTLWERISGRTHRQGQARSQVQLDLPYTMPEVEVRIHDWMRRLQAAGCTVVHDMIMYPEGCDLHLMHAAAQEGTTYEDMKKRFDAGDPEVVRLRQAMKGVAFFGTGRAASTPEIQELPWSKK